MANETTDKVVEALVEVLDKTITPETAQAQALLLQRLVTTGDVIPSRIPAPLNITEIGGYLNLLEWAGESDLREQVLASILGVSGPFPATGFPSAPTVHFASVANHRPEGDAQPTIPTTIRIRDDLRSGVTNALAEIAEHGAALPLLGAPAGLPSVGGAEPTDDDVLAAIGRLVRVVPASALTDPDVDPVALARPDGGSDLQVVARVIDDTAPRAGEVLPAAWEAFTCDAAACTSDSADRRYLEVEPILAGVGWHHPVPTDPVSLGDQGSWDRFTNVTGMIAGETTLGAELRLLYTAEQITASSLRDRLDDTWDGQWFGATGN